ncbi:unnamed protein product [Cuscuta campestris]|uniref:Endonuclease/exonuclease/phosphatase domain-containing protein n=1 Tax=Cuscuta campestris TaxID=132261 RepID=A0A484KD97_9ASTE|nr:unnamed protein product [Cuscuta campestris]
MSTICWNCRGLGNRRTVQEVAELISAKKPEFVFLMETKGSRVAAEELRVRIGFHGLFVVDSVGKSGGLAMLWRSNHTARLISYSRFHVDIEVLSLHSSSWRLTGFYGNPRRDQRHFSWDLLRSLRDKSSLPWLVIGDFNDLCWAAEKRGGEPHPQALFEGFVRVLDDCNLFDISMQGYPFTWERGWGKEWWVEERLDQAVANGAWRILFPQAGVFNNLMRTCDHSALYLCLDTVSLQPVKRQFRFENTWVRDESYQDALKAAWGGTCSVPFLARLEQCGKDLKTWGGYLFQKFGKRIKELKSVVERWRGRRDPEGLKEFLEADKELQKVLDQEDIYWRQRAKQHWLRSADSNTRFFHQYASHRKQKNWQTRETLRKLIFSFYERLFSTEGGVWQLLRVDIFQIGALSFEAWFQGVTCSTSSLELQKISWTIWSIWKARNRAVWEHMVQHPRSTIVQVEAFQRGWTDAATSLKSGGSVVAVPGAVFQPNTAVTGGELCFVDAAVFPQSEAMACREALLWLKGKRIRAFKLFSDCLQLVTAIEQWDRGPFSSYLGKGVDENILLTQEMIHCLDNASGNANIAIKVDFAKAFDRISWGVS